MYIDPDQPITISDVVAIARNNQSVELSQNCIKKVNASHDELTRVLKDGKTVYGINTGYGIFADKKIDTSEIEKLNRNLILSHAVGFGEYLNDDIVRAAMFVRANTLAQGFSGVRLGLIQTLLQMLNRGVTPLIQSQGSLGSSGDLCLLAQMALVATTDNNDIESESGRAKLNGDLSNGKQAMEKANISRFKLGPKEGLAFTNGATFSAALAALIVHESEYLSLVADIATALSMEALASCSAALDDRIHQVRKQTGQINSAKTIRELVTGSSLLDSTIKVQDAYSLRCAPQVHGAVRDTILFVKELVQKEINAATDNPLIFEDGVTLSGGNFHGELVGMAMDYLAIAMTELAAISERRIARMIDEKLSNGLPSMLIGHGVHAGLNSGLMIPHYTAASLVLENQTLATPDSIKSLPTSGNQEDHNANAMTAALHAYRVLQNCRQVLSIEIYTSLAGIDLRLEKGHGKLAPGTKEVYDRLRKVVSLKKEDTIWTAEINKINQLLQKQELGL
jgi:histidine ammonia-lyase